MSRAYRIAGWAAHYETAESRRNTKNRWVATPNSHDSIAYCELIAHPNGMAHYGAWNLILQVASKCPIRGLLVSGSRVIHTPRTLALVTRGSEKIITEAIGRLLACGWLEEFEYESWPCPADAQHTAGHPTTTVQDSTGQDSGRAPTPPPAPPVSPNHDDRWRYERLEPWVRSAQAAGCSVGKSNWYTWKCAMERTGVGYQRFFAIAESLPPDKRYHDRVEAAVMASIPKANGNHGPKWLAWCDAGGVGPEPAESE